MAEALFNHLGQGRYAAVSAGSNPAGYIHPVAIKAMEVFKIPMEGQYSKSWQMLKSLPQDVIITLCDHAAGQPCPLWTGDPIVVHWPLPDPSFHPGDDETRVAAALGVAWTLRRRIEGMICLPLETMSKEDLAQSLRALGEQW